MEQVNLELNEEDEIKRIREAKLNYTKRIIDEKQRVIKVEEEEIKKKRDIVKDFLTLGQYKETKESG